MGEEVSEDANVDQLQHHGFAEGRLAVLDWVDGMLSVATEPVCADDIRVGMFKIRLKSLREG